MRVGQRKKILIPHEEKLTIFNSYSIHKDDAIDIAYASSMQDVCHMNFVIDLVTTESLWLSGRAMDCGIRRSEV